ncbi:hypothetical protein RJT34_13622 [Clitoria ternatea]|uniref:Uncharacterized protein n=1 Tax=Clitoria ternatea TaxID=43366 RepID=A0AAN9JQZ7_CLITE
MLGYIACKVGAHKIVCRSNGIGTILFYFCPFGPTAQTLGTVRGHPSVLSDVKTISHLTHLIQFLPFCFGFSFFTHQKSSSSESCCGGVEAGFGVDPTPE